MSTSIPKLIDDFYQKMIGDKPIKQRLYLDIPEAMMRSEKIFEKRYPEALAEIADERNNPSLTDLRLEDGSLQRSWRSFYPLASATDNDPYSIIKTFNRNLVRYQADIDCQTLLKDDLLPILKELQQGKTPGRFEQAITEQAIDEYGKLFTPYLAAACSHDSEMDKSMVILEDTITAFLDQLLNEIKQVTKIDRVYQGEQQIGRGG